MNSNLRFYLVKKSRSLVCRSQKLRTDVSCTLAMVSRSHLSNYTHKPTLIAASNQRISGSSKPTNRPQIDTKLVLMRRKLIVEYLLIKEEDNVTLQSTQIDGQRHRLSPLFVTYVSNFFFYYQEIIQIDPLILIYKALYITLG